MKGKHKLTGEYAEAFPGTRIEVKGNSALAMNKAISKLKKLVNKERILHEYKYKQFFEKRSVKRRRQRAAARKRHLREKAARED